MDCSTPRGLSRPGRRRRADAIPSELGKPNLKGGRVMRPSPAEIVRTLVAGRLPGLVHLACRPGLHHARHATDPEGRVLLLVPVVSDLAAALGAERPPPGRRHWAGPWSPVGRVGWPVTRHGPPRWTSPRWNPPATCSMSAPGSGCSASRWPRPVGTGPASCAASTRRRTRRPSRTRCTRSRRSCSPTWAEDHAARLTGYLCRHSAGRRRTTTRHGSSGSTGTGCWSPLAFGRRLADRAELTRLLHPVLRAG